MNDASWLTGAVAALSLPTVYFIWVAMRRLVSLGFFLLYTTIGTALAYFGLWSADVQGIQPLPYSVVAGLSFASVCSAIRARIAKLVGIIFIATMVAIIGWRLYS